MLARNAHLPAEKYDGVKTHHEWPAVPLDENNCTVRSMTKAGEEEEEEEKVVVDLHPAHHHM